MDAGGTPVELTLKGLTGHLGPRPTSRRASETPEEFRLRRHVWRQAFRLFTAQHRRARRLARVERRPAPGAVAAVAAAEPRPERIVPAPVDHPLRLQPVVPRPLPVAQRAHVRSSGGNLCGRSRHRFGG